MTDIAVESLTTGREKPRLKIGPDLGAAAVVPEVQAIQIEEDPYEQNTIFLNAEGLIGAARLVNAATADWQGRDDIDAAYFGDPSTLFLDRLGTHRDNYQDCTAATVRDIADPNPAIRFVRSSELFDKSLMAKLPLGWTIQYAYSGPQVDFFGDTVGFTSEPYVLARQVMSMPEIVARTIISRL